MTTSKQAPSGAQSLSRGLTMLSTLVAADRPLTATELARRSGCHQVTASRALAALIEAGFVRKIGFREFAPDFGLLALGGEAARHFTLTRHPKVAMERCAEICAPLTVSLCLLWRDQLLYFDRSTHGFEFTAFNGSDYPLHLSSPGLLFLTEVSRTEALRRLTGSRHKFGWARPTDAMPETEEGVLEIAVRHRRSGTLVLRNWARTGHVTGAIRLPDHHGHPLALTIAGPVDVWSTETLRQRLHDCRTIVQPALPT